MAKSKTSNDPELAFAVDPFVKRHKSAAHVYKCEEEDKREGASCFHIRVQAAFEGRKIGEAVFECVPREPLLRLVNIVIFGEEYKRKRVGTLMILRAKHEKPGYELTADNNRTESGKSFWAALEALDIV